MSRKPVITIDGPAGAGKSTVARQVARRLGLRFLDTGAMYRAFTWKAMQGGASLSDPASLVAMIRASKLEMIDERVVLDGRDISREIRDPAVTLNSKHLADPPAVRAELVRLQQEIGKQGGLVTEGRDQGTVVFPDAEHKFYLDASIEVRAQRRYREAGGDLETIRREIAARDERDRSRAVGGLRIPAGGIVIDSSNMTVEEVCDGVIAWIQGNVGSDPDLERILGYWVNLERARFEAPPGTSVVERLAERPWESTDLRIKAAWDALTHPANLRALEKWLRPDMNPTAQEWAVRALEECRRRAAM